jgi:hypothetical protein
MKPRLLDLFCGAGGAAMGYHRAGFEVVGVDINQQPNYPFDYHQGDALEYVRRLILENDPSDDFDAIHASPPCQHYANVTKWKGEPDDHAALIEPTRELLEATGLPWVMENVRTPAIRADYMLCGTTLRLRVRRHRHFETNWTGGMVMGHPCQHSDDDYSFDHGGKQPESVYREAMGVEWMTVQESREAIPPAYTEYIGRHLFTKIVVPS